MSDGPGVIPYSTDGGSDAVDPDAATFNVSARHRLTLPLLITSFWLINPAIYVYGLARAPGAACSVGTGLMMLVLLLPVTAFACAYSAPLIGNSREIIRPAESGFVLERSAWGRRKLFNVDWHEVGEIDCILGPKPLFLPASHWLRIQLLNTDSDKIVPMELMRNRPTADIERVAGELRSWRDARGAVPLPVVE